MQVSNKTHGEKKKGAATTWVWYNKQRGGAGMEPNSQLEFLFQSAFESGS